MDDETRRRAFEPFFTTKQEKEGSGLGLSSVYGTVAQSGGFVLLETEVDVGTTFSLYLPVAAAPVEARARTILLAEDEEIVRDLTEQILKNAGYDVLTAGDGAEALVLYERAPRRDRRRRDRHRHARPRRPRARAADPRARRRPADRLHLGPSRGDARDTAARDRRRAPAEAVLGRRTRRHDRPARRRGAPHRLRSRASAQPTCVLADDHPAVLDSVSRFLESRGVRVSQARDGDRGARDDPGDAARRRDRRRRDVADVGHRRGAAGRRRQPDDEGDPLHRPQRPRAARPRARSRRTRLRPQGRRARVARGSGPRRRRRRDVGRLEARDRGRLAGRPSRRCRR